uniref:Uncharacterized protein n=1 Tax=viral metagenome TaxID=1070528 RepID=A0A6M3LW70_9ZZZZ
MKWTCGMCLAQGKFARRVAWSDLVQCAYEPEQPPCSGDDVCCFDLEDWAYQEDELKLAHKAIHAAVKARREAERGKLDA